MAKIYVSSTFVDLREHRQAVVGTLRQLGHRVLAMEDYHAEDQIPLEKCREHVSSADLFVGIFGWRYGYVPEGQRKSITELEYEAAGGRQIPRLAFLVDRAEPWPPEHIDAFTGDGQAGERIRALREELQRERLVSFFRSPDHLAREVGVSVSVALSQAWLRPLHAANDLAGVDRGEIEGSEVQHISDKVGQLIRELQDVRVLDIDLDRGDYWWSTRLFLVSALVLEYTDVECLLFLAEGSRFVGLASVAAVVTELAKTFPAVAREYYATLPDLDERQDPLAQATERVDAFTEGLKALEGGERARVTVVSQSHLKRWLGSSLVRDSVETEVISSPQQAHAILGQPGDYVALTSDQELIGVVRRADLATSIAKGVVQAGIEMGL